MSESSDVGVNVPQPSRSPSRLHRPPPPPMKDGDVDALQKQLAERDKQLEEQAQQLAEMEMSLKEIQALIPDASGGVGSPSRKVSTDMDAEAGLVGGGGLEMRRMIREKNDKINSLITEFDAHRADFRSTIETLEMASDETVRMYEARIQELIGEMENLRDSNTAQKDVESIAAQLKMLEDLVAELEDGLEDARRGEAEARGEVEFLRGEVERGRSELKREREKTAALSSSSSSLATVVNGKSDKGTAPPATPAAAPAPAERDYTALLEMKDDEIRGLKAILHSNQSGGQQKPNGRHSLDEDAVGGSNGRSKNNGKSESIYSIDAEEMRRVQESLHRLEMQNADLEAQLRREQDGKHGAGDVAGASGGGSSATGRSKTRTDTGIGEKKPQSVAPVAPVAIASTQHDISSSAPSTAPTAVADKKPQATAVANVDEEKWCALCEQDGHLAFDCPNEQY